MVKIRMLQRILRWRNVWLTQHPDHLETIPKEAAELIEKIIPNMNRVLSQIVPGLSISMYNFGPQVLKNGNIGCRVQLMSRKNNKEIPLRYESEGIKKIVSILQLLIVVYNKPSITLAIDELDAGVFEYLLGELLRIISEKGKGQLIYSTNDFPLTTVGGIFCGKLKAVKNDRVQIFAISKKHPDIFHTVIGKISLIILGKLFLDTIQ